MQQPSQMGKPKFRGCPPRFVGYGDDFMRMFTKKHYVVIARAINAAWRQEVMFDTQGQAAGVSHVANKIAEAFKADNPQFDIFKFVEACTRATDPKR